MSKVKPTSSKPSTSKGESFREHLLKTASNVRAKRDVKTPEDYADARDVALHAIINGDKDKENSKDIYEINRKPMIELMEISASEGFTSAILYRWRYCHRASDRTWTFNNVRLRDLLFRRPSEDASFKDNETLMEKLQTYANSEFGEGFKIIFKRFIVQPKGTKKVSDSKERRSPPPNQNFQLSIIWSEPREKEDVKDDSDDSSDED
jgi:hypothetical protein